jgi:hypothetical protein
MLKLLLGGDTSSFPGTGEHSAEMGSFKIEKGN